MAFYEQILSNLNSFSIEILLIGIIPILLYWYSIKKQSYWKDRNVPYVKPLPFIGSLLDTMRTPFPDLEMKRYRALGPIYGVFEFNEPTLTVADPKLIREIMIRDFTQFINKKSFKTGNSLSDQMLVFSEGEDWKRIRTIISPTFSTGKIKRVLGIFKECSRTIVKNFKASSERNEPVDAKKFLGAFAMDLIASTAFSTKLDSHNDPENRFVKYARTFIGTDFRRTVILVGILNNWPLLRKFTNLSVFDATAMEYFKKTTLQIISERKRTKQTRDDFLQLLLDTADKTVPKEKNYDIENDNDFLGNYGQNTAGQKFLNTSYTKNLTNEELVAQCCNFFAAAYDTTSTLLTYTMYELAVNQDIQEKAYKEVAQQLQETNGEVTYEALKNMKYMDNIISESLRLHPPVMRLSRRVDKEYKLGDTGIILEKDMVIFFPVIVLHMDPKYYPDPEKYDPDRFSEKEIAKRDPYAFLPFGHGPRNCIGNRFALMVAKVCLVHIISCFKIITCPETKIPVESEYTSFIVAHPKGVKVALEIRYDSPLLD